MTDTIIELSEDAFAAHYPLRTNHLNPAAIWAYGEGVGCLFETYGEELAFVRDQDPRTVWTLIDGDDGDQCILSGFHLVNRLGYLVSTVPIPVGTTIQVRIPMQSEEAAEATTHTPEPWTYNHSAIVQDSRGNMIADCAIVPESEDVPSLPAQEVANAHRICDAVNACKGISTEALERGSIGQLRHVLSELLTAAGDLDAALDGATDQFDAERAKLTAIIRAAQVVHDGKELDMHELLAGSGQIALGWSVEDVQEVRPDLTDEQAWEVLQQVERKHDATLGVTWTTLEVVAEVLFGDAPETDSQT